MKKQLLAGAFVLASFLTAKAQGTCATALDLPTGTTTVGTINGTYVANCWAGDQDEATAANWYKFTATANGAVRINTNIAGNEDNDTRVSVYSGTCDALQCWSGSDDVFVGAQDDPNNIFTTDFQFPVLEGDTYYIAFDNQWDDAGFGVEVSFVEPSCLTNTNTLNEDWSNYSNFFFCWGTADINNDTVGWTLRDDINVDTDDINTDPVAVVFPGAVGVAKEDALISPTLTFTAGSQHTFKIKYNGINLQDNQENVIDANESFSVMIVGGAEANADFSQEIGSEEGIAQNGDVLTDLKANALEGTYTFTADVAGDYALAIIANSPADTGALAIFKVTMDATAGINDNVIATLAVTPNPTSSVVNITNNENALLNGVVVTDLNGRTVKTAKFAGVAEAQVNVSDLASGVYMMTISSDKGSVTKKIVKN